MAQNTIQMIIELLIKETGGNLGQMEKQVEAVGKAFSSLKSKAQFAEMGAGMEKVADGSKAIVNALRLMDFRVFSAAAAEAKKLWRELDAVSRVNLNIDVSKVKETLAGIAQETRAWYREMKAAGAVEFKLNLTKPLSELEKATLSVANFNKEAAKTPVMKVDVTQVSSALKKVKEETDKTVESKQRLATATQQNNSNYKSLNSTLAEVASNFLFVRRVLIAITSLNLADKIIETVAAFDKLSLTMKTVFNQKASEELSFIRQTADRLGISITDLGNGWAKFAASVDPAKVSMATMRENFLAVAEAGSALGLSAEEINGTLTALSQIASKGRLSMEELRQQLGDRLPGAVKIAADALGLTQSKLFALIEQGKIGSDVFLNAFPKALRASFGTDANSRVETLGAAIARFQNALKEMIDVAVRSGALDSLRQVIDGLAKAFKDPALIDNVGKVVEGLSKLALFALENARLITTLVAVMAGLKTFGAINTILANGVATLTSLGAAATVAGTGMTTVAAGTAAAGTAAVAAAPAVGTLGVAVRGLAAAIAGIGPIAIAVIGGAAALLVVNEIQDALIKSKDKANDFADAMRTVASQEKVAGFFRSQAAALQLYANVTIEATDEVERFGEAEAVAYRKALEGAIAFEAVKKRERDATIAGMEAALKALEVSGDSSAKAMEDANRLRAALAGLTKEQETGAARSLELSDALRQVALKAKESHPEIKKNTEELLKLTGGFSTAAKAGKELATTDLSKLNKDVQELVTGFKKVKEEGASAVDAFKKALPKDWLEGSANGLVTVGKAAQELAQKGLLPAKDAAEVLQKEIQKLDGKQLVEFGQKAAFAFEIGALKGQALSVILKGQLAASMEKLGLDSKSVGENISKAFHETSLVFQSLAKNAEASGKQIKQGLDVAVAAAKTKEELAALSKQVDELGLRGGKFGKDVSDSLTRLEDKIRLTAGTLNSALGDSFERMGIITKEKFDALAKQAEIDFERIKISGLATAEALVTAFNKTELGKSFERLGTQAKFALATLSTQAQQDFEKIKNSGQASALGIETAFREMIAKVAAATETGIPPIRFKFEAINANAFDVLVSMAQTASEKIKKAMLEAIPLADTKAKLELLAEGIEAAFDRGKISVQEFGEVMFKVGQQMRETMAKPVGEVLAVVEKFGFQTKDMLKATADNAREAFDVMRFSGEFTTQELAKAAQQYMDAYKAANDGVVDSFDPVIQKAQEVIDKVGETTKKVEEMNKMSAPVQTGNLRDKRPEELQTMLSDLTKAYRAIGVQNVQDLQIIQEIQKEMNRQGKEDAERRRAEIDAAAAQLDNVGNKLVDSVGAASGGGRPAGGSTVGGKGPLANSKGQPLSQSSPITVNINGNNTITPDVVKRQIAPVLRRATQRSI